MIENSSSITYRGSLKSCNYSCTYCPFGKEQMTKEELRVDRVCLERFLHRLDEIPFKKPVSVLFVPYGEALIHEYYQKAIALLSRKESTLQIGCQTNGSFSAMDLIGLLDRFEADFNKIFLWITYHPEMTEPDTFVSQVKQLSERLDLSVGVIGDPESLGKIKLLRELLPPQIYLWVNGMDGMKLPYNEEEIQQLLKIDPLFFWEMTRGRPGGCEGGLNHLFINAAGELFACNRSKKRLGNIYAEEGKDSIRELRKKRSDRLETCTGRHCDCYLAYAHTNDFIHSSFMGTGSHLRVPKRLTKRKNKPIKAIFLDVDGTLTDNTGKISAETIKALRYISGVIPVFLATELPEKAAVNRCRPILSCLSGGSFAGGAYWADWEMEVCGAEPISHNSEAIVNGWLETEGGPRAKYSYEEKTYRITIPEKTGRKLALQDLPEDIKLDFCGGRKAAVGKQGVTKMTGISAICRLRGIETEQAMAVGNSKADETMIRDCGTGVLVPPSDSSDCGWQASRSQRNQMAADFTLRVSEIPFLI